MQRARDARDEEKQRAKRESGGVDATEEGVLDSALTFASVLAASPEGTLSIRVAKEIPQLYRQYHPVDTSGGTVVDLTEGLNTSAG